MYGNIIIVAIAIARVIAALPTTVMPQPILGDIVATTQGLSTENSIGRENLGLIHRGSGGSLAGAGLTVTNTTNHNPQLKPAYIAIIAVASVIALILVISTIFRCVVCTSAGRKKRVERKDAEKGATKQTIIDPCVSVPMAVMTKPERLVEEAQLQMQPEIKGNQANHMTTSLPEAASK
ncbi:hypothetical protein F4775DRAFT_588719 [Biscogniauxia sp. FL1348]|nr:hypothetical protein F4775DRAFT_588719 [Biscogniauxia sp. FL1348]